MKSTKIVQAIVFAIVLQGCSGQGGNAGDGTRALHNPPAGAAVVTVNGEVVTEQLLGTFARGRGLDPADPDQRQRALDLLVDTLLMAQDAIATGVAAKPEVQAEVALVGMQQLAGRALASYREDVAVGEPELRAYYDQEVKRTGKQELHLQHILFEDRASAAEAAADATKPGADFEAIMGEYAAKGAKQAKDLGWGNLGQFPAELAEAALTLQDGEVGATPLKTDYGWHVFRRVGARPYTPPSFEQVREGARKQLTEQALADKAKSLREKATIVEAGKG